MRRSAVPPPSPRAPRSETPRNATAARRCRRLRAARRHLRGGRGSVNARSTPRDAARAPRALRAAVRRRRSRSGIRKAPQDVAGRIDQDVVAFFGPQVRDHNHFAPRRSRATAVDHAIDVEAVRHDGDLARGHALAHQPSGGGARVGDDDVGAGVGGALQRDVRRALVGVQLAPVADPHRHAGERGAGERRRCSQ